MVHTELNTQTYILSFGAGHVFLHFHLEVGELVVGLRAAGLILTHWGADRLVAGCRSCLTGFTAPVWQTLQFKTYGRNTAFDLWPLQEHLFGYTAFELLKSAWSQPSHTRTKVMWMNGMPQNGRSVPLNCFILFLFVFEDIICVASVHVWMRERLSESAPVVLNAAVLKSTWNPNGLILVHIVNDSFSTQIKISFIHCKLMLRLWYENHIPS